MTILTGRRSAHPSISCVSADLHLDDLSKETTFTDGRGSKKVILKVVSSISLIVLVREKFAMALNSKLKMKKHNKM